MVTFHSPSSFRGNQGWRSDESTATKPSGRVGGRINILGSWQQARRGKSTAAAAEREGEREREARLGALSGGIRLLTDIENCLATSGSVCDQSASQPP
jgi:hypothetical protein